jgi:hypothetical protein
MLGPFGARYLMEHHPKMHRDALLDSMPSSLISGRV